MAGRLFRLRGAAFGPGEAAMIGRSGFHGLLRNMRASPWTRRSLTESLLLRRTTSAAKSHDRDKIPVSPSTSLSFRAWEASLAIRLRKDKDEKR